MFIYSTHWLKRKHFKTDTSSSSKRPASKQMSLNDYFSKKPRVESGTSSNVDNPLKEDNPEKQNEISSSQDSSQMEDGLVAGATDYNELDMIADSPMLEDDAGISQEFIAEKSKTPTQSDGSSESEEESKSNTKNDKSGCSIGELNTSLVTPSPISSAPNDSHHTILIRPYIDPKRPPRPFPDSYQDNWDSSHVRMPCSPENRCPQPVENESGKTVLIRRWDAIEKALRQPIRTSIDLEEAILSYNSRFNGFWNFDGLHVFFSETLTSEESNEFFDKLLPEIIKLALNLPHIVTRPPPLLKCGSSSSVTMSQHQIASLLANAFLCTFPRRNAHGNNAEFGNYPSINFTTLYSSPPSRNRYGRNTSASAKSNQQRRKHEKLKAILHYFRRISSSNDMPCGVVTFSRRVLIGPQCPDWSNSTCQFNFRLHCTSHGMIEDVGKNMLQVDFANKVVGGGVLANGCVQEEIRFVLCPELLVSRLFTEILADREALIIQGAERFSRYVGYSDTFTWDGDYQDSLVNTRDDWGRWRTYITAIDAVAFRNYWDQFTDKNLKRELNKAYVGFADFSKDSLLPLPQTVATGNWGCGAFGGDRHLKALLQMMVCAEAGKDLCYFTFGENKLRDDIVEMHVFLNEKHITVGEVWNHLQHYFLSGQKESLKKQKENLYLFLQKALSKT